MTLMLLDWLTISAIAERPINCLVVKHIINSDVSIARDGVSSQGSETVLWQLSSLHA